MYALIISYANISGLITGEFENFDDAIHASEVVENTAGSWLQDHVIPELNMDGAIPLSEPIIQVMDSGMAREQGFIN